MLQLIPAQTVNVPQGPANDKWKADAFLNVSLRVRDKKTGEEKLVRLDTTGLRLRKSRKFDAQLIEKIQQDPSYVERMPAQLVVEFRMADGSSNSAEYEIEL